jgi:acetyl-CoA carboxylase biotin carboxyl carrier protein
MMDISYVKKIVKLIENSEVDEIEIEEEGKRIRVSRTKSRPEPVNVHTILPSAAPPVPAQPYAAPTPAPIHETPPKAEAKYHEIRSPIVGTFYRAPSPDADPYVDVGHSVSKGDVLCIVEAMKLMNEIESDIAGEIVKILVENAKPVEYNQALFLIKPL